MKITKNKLKQIIKEEVIREGDFGVVEDLLEILATKFNVMEDEAAAFLRQMADKLEGV